MLWWIFYGRKKANRDCPHPWWRVYCTHGDEIIAVGYKRSRCLECQRWFDDLPVWCYQNKRAHGASEGLPYDYR